MAAPRKWGSGGAMVPVVFAGNISAEALRTTLFFARCAVHLLLAFQVLEFLDEAIE
jgi:hypothetical protein